MSALAAAGHDRTAQAWAVLATVPDPEVPAISLCELGIVRAVLDHGDALEIVLTPTYSGCPATEFIERSVVEALDDAGLGPTRVSMRRAPAWTTDWMTEAGKEKLRAYGIAPPHQTPAGSNVVRFISKPAHTETVPCPHCGALQWLRFERLRWEAGRPETAAYVCEHCEEPIAERHKTAMMDEGNGACWIATAEPEVRELAEASGTVGYHISGLYSPLGWLSWEEVARGWEAAQKNDAALKTLKNTILGETWQERGEAPDWQRLYERRDSWQLGQAPEGVLVLTAGADVQRDRIEIDVWGWGRGLRSWLVDHIVLDGDVARPEVWAALDAVLGQTWPHASGARMSLARLAIDTGDGVTVDAVYAWVRRAGRGQVVAVKGVGGFDRSMPVEGPTYVEVTEAGRKIRRGLQLWKVAGAVFKSELYRFLRLARPTDEELAAGAGWPPGYVHIPRGTTAEWLRQLTAEQLVTVRSKAGFARLEWQQLRERNEALDCRVYARACAFLMGIDRWDDPRWETLESQLDAGGAAEARPAGQPNRPRTEKGARRSSDWMGPRRGKWF